MCPPPSNTPPPPRLCHRLLPHLKAWPRAAPCPPPPPGHRDLPSVQLWSWLARWRIKSLGCIRWPALSEKDHLAGHTSLGLFPAQSFVCASQSSMLGKQEKSFFEKGANFVETGFCHVGHCCSQTPTPGQPFLLQPPTQRTWNYRCVPPRLVCLHSSVRVFSARVPRVPPALTHIAGTASSTCNYAAPPG